MTLGSKFMSKGLGGYTTLLCLAEMFTGLLVIVVIGYLK